MSASADLQKLLTRLRRDGLLLKQDKTFPNVVTLVTGERLAGSWWSHPAGHEIFAVLEALADHRDVLLAKLVANRDTFVHRRLWPALLAVGLAREDWQLRGLSASAKRLLARLDQEGEVHEAGEAGKELAQRLLCVGRQAHTASGRHATVLESWPRWSKREQIRRDRLSPGEGRAALEAAIAHLGAAPELLPWRRTRGSKR